MVRQMAFCSIYLSLVVCVCVNCVCVVVCVCLAFSCSSLSSIYNVSSEKTLIDSTHKGAEQVRCWNTETLLQPEKSIGNVLSKCLCVFVCVSVFVCVCVKERIECEALVAVCLGQRGAGVTIFESTVLNEAKPDSLFISNMKRLYQAIKSLFQNKMCLIIIQRPYK